jgi:hypothetical protein
MRSSARERGIPDQVVAENRHISRISFVDLVAVLVLEEEALEARGADVLRPRPG